jgi:rhodanese-related sulfurtransferase
MFHARSRLTLLALAVALAGAGAFFGSRPAAPSIPASERPVEALDPFAVAATLAEAPPDAVVIALDTPRHPLRGAIPAAAFGGDDATLVAQAPKARRVILAGADPVRVDRVARKLRASGRRAAVLAGGTSAWDQAMDADPPAPAPTASAATWQKHRAAVALRRSFGDAEAAPAAPVAAPATPVMAAPSGPKKREGC